MMNGILHNRLQNKFDNLAFLDFFRYINLYLKPVGKADILYLQIVVRLPQFLPDPYDILSFDIIPEHFRKAAGNLRNIVHILQHGDGTDRIQRIIQKCGLI